MLRMKDIFQLRQMMAIDKNERRTRIEQNRASKEIHIKMSWRK